MFFDLESSLVLVLSLLRPQYLASPDRPYHREEYEEVGDEEQDGKGIANYLDALAVKRLSYGKRGRCQCGVGEHKGEPGHRKSHPSTTSWCPVRKDCYKEEENRQPRTIFFFC